MGPDRAPDMTGPVRVKICGLSNQKTLDAAVAAGAGYVGFVLEPKSPRYVTLEQAARLAVTVPPGVAKVALMVDPDNARLDEITAQVPLDILQLHGHESPERVAEVRERYGLPVMKAVGLADAGDLAELDRYEPVADLLLVDAKPPKGGDLPGGNGLAFDWRLIAGRKWQVPWLLAGGLTAATVADAVALTGAQQVDLSSGVETAPGVKDADLIRGFLAAAA